LAKYLLYRLLGAVPLVLGISTIIFFVMSAAPGDMVDIMVRPGMTAEVAQQLRASHGLDQPVVVRYVKWMGATLRGDFGHSVLHGRPVLDVIRIHLPRTLILSLTALAIAFIVGIVLGTIQAIRQYSWLDSGLSVVLLFFYSMPSFWLAYMLILTFSLFARNVWEWPIWFPATGMLGTDHESLSFVARVADRLRFMVLPTLSLSLVLTAGIARYMRGSMLEVVRQDFIRTARAKGLPERAVVFKHALRNALLPVITLLGLYIPVLFSGTVIIEDVFGWPGMGTLMIQAIDARDYMLVMGVSFFFALMVVIGNLIADVLYAVVDPRIRYE